MYLCKIFEKDFHIYCLCIFFIFRIVCICFWRVDQNHCTSTACGSEPLSCRSRFELTRLSMRFAAQAKRGRVYLASITAQAQQIRARKLPSHRFVKKQGWLRVWLPNPGFEGVLYVCLYLHLERVFKSTAQPQ